MSNEILSVYLTGSLAICAVGALLNIALIKKRGTSAALLAIAFIVLGFTIEGYRTAQPMALLSVGCACVVGLLIADFVVRAAKQGRDK